MKIYLILTTIFFSEFVLAQGEFVDRGYNAFGGEVSIGFAKQATAIGGSLGASILGTLDLGFSYGIVMLPANATSVDPQSRAYAPSISLHALKQDSLVPLSFSGYLSFQTQEFTLLSSTQTFKVHTVTYGGQLARNFHLTETFDMQPSFGLFFTEAEDVRLNFTTVEVSTQFISISGNKRYVVRPSIAFSKDQTLFSISVAFVSIFTKP